MRVSHPKRLGHLPSAAGAMARLAYSRVREAGIDLASLLKMAGLTRREIEDRRARLDVKSQIALIDLAADALDDDFLGFHLVRDADLRGLGQMYYVFSSAETLGDALRRAERFTSLSNEAVSVHILEGGEELSLTLRYVGVERHSDRQQMEALLTVLLRICRHVTNSRVIPLRAGLVHQRPGGAPELSTFFGCKISFGAPTDQVVFSTAVAQMPVASADPYLSELLIRYCEEALAHRAERRNTLRLELENAVVPLLPHGKAQVDAIARRLGMSRRTLARRLAAQGLSFAGIMTELKRDLAHRYLRDDDLGISQVAWLLGYREVSAFTHAFKRWTGKTPREARAQKNFTPAKTRTHKAEARIRAHR